MNRAHHPRTYIHSAFLLGRLQVQITLQLEVGNIYMENNDAQADQLLAALSVNYSVIRVKSLDV